MESKSTHIVFNGKEIFVSPDLLIVITFLQEVEQEVNTLLGFYDKLESIRKQYLEMLEFTGFLANKLKENSIDFKFNFKEKPDTIVDKLKLNRPIRAETIAIFAYLEALFCLHIAYANKTSNQKEIIGKAMDQNCVKLFLEEFCLNETNEWCKKNPERFRRINSDEIRKLRNSLTHFFSVSKGLGLSYALLDEKSRRLEKATNYKAKFLSPEDLYEILKGAAKTMIKKWSEDCQNSLKNENNDFKEKILCVKSVVESSASVMVTNDQINI